PTAADPTATDPGTSPDLLAALRRELPEYLVPSQVVTVAELPVTANGKVDVDALPLPPAARWEAPRPGTERTLAEIVAELL
ncbi:AMP-binding enzyme, partial [Corynebacterium bovis]